MKERTQIALLSAALGLSFAVSLSLWLEANAEISRYLFPAIIGSLTALTIAFVAYPWQKNLDREHELARERRAIYAEVVADWIDIYQSLLSISKGTDTWKVVFEVEAILRRCEMVNLRAGLVAPKPILDELGSMHGELQSVVDKMRIAFLEVAPKNDTDQVSGDVLRKALFDPINSWAPDRFDRLLSLINDLRIDEFEAKGGVELAKGSDR